ncbi:HAD family hydrolase [Streptomyces sp. NPDC056663]|uniref:HAD family hydrolase n=1 Tax=Streptomyces sp. NPDC056663 TaxID=3345899 RepID=UPI0036BCC200
MSAADGTRLTPHADELVLRLRDAGYFLAVTSSNSAEVASRYFAGRRTTGCFEHVRRQMSDLKLLKPNPDCLRRALESTGAAAADALMTGDSPSDRHAAQRLGVSFIGFAKNDRKSMALSAGVNVIVRSLRSLVEAVDWVYAEERRQVSSSVLAGV